MTITYDENKIRYFSGAPSSLIDTTTLEGIFDQVKSVVLGELQVNETPSKAVEIGNGNNSLQYLIKKRFATKILSCKIRSTVIDVNTIILNWKTGMISLDTTSSNTFSLFPFDPNSVKIKFESAFMDKTTTVTETTTALTAGDSVSFVVDDASGISQNDYILIESTTPRNEVCKVTNVSSNTITVDKLSHNHDNEAVVTKMDTDILLDQLVLYETCIAVALNAIGSTYTFNTSYSVEGVTVNKGVPYPHWEKSLNQNTKLRDDVLKIIRRRLQIIN